MGQSNLLAEALRTYVSERLAAKIEQFEKIAEKRRRDAVSDEQVALEQKLHEERNSLVAQYQPENWLTDAARRAGQISMVTHAPKYTHSDTRSTGVYLKTSDEAPEGNGLHSQVLKELPVDVVGNAAALDVARLLQQEADGRSLLDEVAAEDSPALRALATSDDQYLEWMRGFQAALQDKELKSGQLAKQLYFPVADSYHLISPLYATSLSQKLYDRLTTSFYGESAKAAREARKKERYYPDDVVLFPNVAIQSFGGTKPQNISQLNTSRYGRGYLLSSQPPVWSHKTRLPLGGKNAFWREYERRAWRIARNLRDYLERVFHRTSTMERRDRREELVDELVDTLLIYAAEIQQREYKGWSAESSLNEAEQLWLDPYRSEMDETFKQKREANGWQQEVARKFAAWLNDKLSYKSSLLSAGDAEFREWRKLLERKLLSLKTDLEVDR